MDPRDDRGGVEPEVDLLESDDAFLLRVALPGVSPQDIQIEATGHRIFLSAEGGAPSTAPSGRQSRILRRSGVSQASRFQFSTSLPFEIDPNAAQARYKHGMLTLRLPKRQIDAHRRVPVPVQAEENEPAPAPPGAPAMPAPALARASSAPPPPEEWMHEGRPAAKMGMAYTPTGSEDHTAKAQSLSQQAEQGRNPQPNGVTSAVTTGQTNPLEPPPPAPVPPKT